MPNAIDSMGLTPLAIACRNSFRSIVKVLCAHPEVDVWLACRNDYQSRHGINRVLFGILINDNDDQVELSNLSDNVTVDSQNLSHAAKKDDLNDVLALLNKSNTDVNFRNPTLKLKTAIHIAAERNNNDIVDALLHHRSLNLSIRDIKGRTVLHYAAKHKHIMKLITKRLDLLDSFQKQSILFAQDNDGMYLLTLNVYVNYVDYERDEVRVSFLTNLRYT